MAQRAFATANFQEQMRRARPLDPATFEHLRQSVLRPSLNRTGLVLLRVNAVRERDLRESYRGRAAYELLQNADDVGATKAAFVTCNDGLAFLHDGRWFTVENFKNLAEGWSDKDPNQCIGHKGIGFRAVLDITPSPHVIHVDTQSFFGVKFTWALNNGHIQEILRADPELRREYEDWTRHGQRACPVMTIPGTAKKASLGAASSILDQACRGSFGADLTTMFWLPAEDADIPSAVLRDLGPTPITSSGESRNRLTQFVEKEVAVLLPFLHSITDVRVFESGKVVASVVIPEPGLARDGALSVVSTVQGRATTRSYFQIRLAKPIPPPIYNLADTPIALRQMREAKVVLSVEIEGEQPLPNPDSRFHVYFPTEERTGVGFVIHGDFYVKPDRKGLMPGGYNEWLLGCAAEAAANEFLTRLLEQYEPRLVFEALQPNSQATSEAAETFRQQYARALQKRMTPFIPTSDGFVGPADAVLPPALDREGFWAQHFSDGLQKVIGQGTNFLAPVEDSAGTRAFLEFAGVKALPIENLLDLVEASWSPRRTADWWYDCYVYMAQHSEISLWPRSRFQGRRLIPVPRKRVREVPVDDGQLVVMPPPSRSNLPDPPSTLAGCFVFLERDLSNSLRRSDGAVRSWVASHLGITAFEASELIPGAVRTIAPQIFAGSIQVTFIELVNIWQFLWHLIRLSRPIHDPEFWAVIGRLPVPLKGARTKGPVATNKLAPAFLGYWPDPWLDGTSCLKSVPGFRRISEGFLSKLSANTQTSVDEWKTFFRRVGVSDFPQLRVYRRIVSGDQIPLEPNGLPSNTATPFSGERQSDENRAVMELVRDEGLWASFANSATSCGHRTSPVLHLLSIVEGVGRVVDNAVSEFQMDDSTSRSRLWDLIRRLPIPDTGNTQDSAYCGGGGGHFVSLSRYIDSQLDRYEWVPTFHGPRRRRHSFLRMGNRRLISTEPGGEELGDLLLPYAVAATLDEFSALEKLEVEALDGTTSASSSALVRCLASLGERLSSEWGKQAVLASKSRWRLVRGAIQEIYRVLNQRDEQVLLPPGLRLAMRTGAGVDFQEGSWFYAEPGSATEKAFLGQLSLLDADRPYQRLFERLAVTSLVPGRTVQESLASSGATAAALKLREQIVTGLGPFLLAPIIAKSDDPKQADLVVRRLKERFDAVATPRITVSITLTDYPSLSGLVEFSKFYLQREVVAGQGAQREAKYTLYVVGSEGISFDTIDADAIGDALAPVFLDGASQELVGYFPRIASRYQAEGGNPAAMSAFLLGQMGVSREAQEEARQRITGEIAEVTPLTAPPPAKLISWRPDPGDNQRSAPPSAEQLLQQHKIKLEAQAGEVLDRISVRPYIPAAETDSAPQPIVRAPAFQHPGTSPLSSGVTPEQEERGRRGEEEVKRRTGLPGGWEGFTLVADRRSPGHGYDFLCTYGQREIKLEVKSFAPNGRVVVPHTELQEAATSGGDYYLVGLCDDGGPPETWRAFIVPNPIELLLRIGEFELQTKLVAPAAGLFGMTL